MRGCRKVPEEESPPGCRDHCGREHLQQTCRNLVRQILSQDLLSEVLELNLSYSSHSANDEARVIRMVLQKKK